MSIEQEIRNEIDNIRQLKIDVDDINNHLSVLEGLCRDRNKKVVDDAYQRGLDDAWETAKKLFSSMADSDIDKAFPIEWNNGGFKALMNLQPQEVIKKLKAYEEKQKADEDVKRGDVVRSKVSGLTYIVTLASEGGYVLFGSDGNFATSCTTNSFEKTGRHFDIASILEDMRND